MGRGWRRLSWLALSFPGAGQSVGRGLRGGVGGALCASWNRGVGRGLLLRDPAFSALQGWGRSLRRGVTARAPKPGAGVGPGQGCSQFQVPGQKTGNPDFGFRKRSSDVRYCPGAVSGEVAHCSVGEALEKPQPGQGRVLDSGRERILDRSEECK